VHDGFLLAFARWNFGSVGEERGVGCHQLRRKKEIEMVMVWILMGIGLPVVKEGSGRCSACRICEQGHGWKWSNSDPASHHERFLS
jgi:hypothetical protein